MGFGGPQCDRCAPGFRSYPICEPCPCDIRGIDLTIDCETSCTCKKNVEGEKCDHCKPGYFALSKDNPDGCLQCYCSGVSNTCHSSTEMQLHAVSQNTEYLHAASCTSHHLLEVSCIITNYHILYAHISFYIKFLSAKTFLNIITVFTDICIGLNFSEW